MKRDIYIYVTMCEALHLQVMDPFTFILCLGSRVWIR